MIRIYVENEFIEINNENEHRLNEAIWIDLLNPRRKEEKRIEKYFKIAIPTKKERQEIEPSSRLYEEDDNLFMTATMLANSKSPAPQTDAVTFVLTKKQLITIRYIEPQSFKVFSSRLSKPKKKAYDAKRIFIGLLETTTDRLADILEDISHEFDKISLVIFRESGRETKKINYHTLLQKIGINGDLSTRVRESLVSFTRLISFVDQVSEPEMDSHSRLMLSIIYKDIQALNDYASFISTKINFLLDATLGMINIEQNNIIKIFSVAAVIFLPPTLIASIYGMNFTFMPELNTRFGYPIAIGLMIVSAIFPYLYFKRKKWL